jgi:hypothetical protein
MWRRIVFLECLSISDLLNLRTIELLRVPLKLMEFHSHPQTPTEKFIASLKTHDSEKSARSLKKSIILFENL